LTDVSSLDKRARLVLPVPQDNENRDSPFPIAPFLPRGDPLSASLASVRARDAAVGCISRLDIVKGVLKWETSVSGKKLYYTHEHNVWLVAVHAVSVPTSVHSNWHGASELKALAQVHGPAGHHVFLHATMYYAISILLGAVSSLFRLLKYLSIQQGILKLPGGLQLAFSTFWPQRHPHT
jgi:hypothetical protein